MANKTNFTPEEWTLLLESPLIASMAVSAADPNGLWGLLQESFAAGGALAQASTDAQANALVKAVAMDFTTGSGGSAARDALRTKFAGSKPADVRTQSVESLRQVSPLLAAKAPDDAAAFKSWLCQISQRTADAASEGGGLLGFGGVPVSNAEKATLSEISSALNA